MDAGVAKADTLGLKRSLSDAPKPHYQNGMPHVPPPTLPKIDGDLLLQVYTHKSLRKTMGDDEAKLCDNERLAVLGKSVLDLVITDMLFRQKPLLDAEEMEIEQAQLFREVEWAQWYHMTENIRYHPDLHGKLQAEEAGQTVFRAYTGAVFITGGIKVAQEWIYGLLTSDTEQSTYPVDTLVKDSPPHKRLKTAKDDSGPYSIQPPIFFASQPPPHSLRSAPQAVQTTGPTPNPLTPAQPNLPFLPSFHQAATRRGVSISYPAEFSGPSHAGQWTVQCFVNGILKGVGTSGHKQAAKEEAAKQAYYAMGWT